MQPSPRRCECWPHRLAVVLVCATFPLIFVGGLVTTYDAGMAVPDWPTTYGYNLFLYPWQTWIYGPLDLFVEHGHRLLGAVVGLLTLLLAAVLWRRDERGWVRMLGILAVAGVIGQGVLGGMRVRLDERLLAQLHACTAPAFFATCVALCVVTSDRWRMRDRGPWTGRERGPWTVDRGPGTNLRARASNTRLARLAGVTAVLAYLQILVGSQLRHMQPSADPTLLMAAVWFHLFLAAALAGHVFLLALRTRLRGADRWVRRPAGWLALLICVQLALGAGTWVVNYGFPVWLDGFAWSEGFVVVRYGRMQVFLTTAHVAAGSLALGIALTAALRAGRLAAQELCEAAPAARSDEQQQAARSDALRVATL